MNYYQECDFNLLIASTLIMDIFRTRGNIIESDITQNRTKTFFLVLQIKDFQLNQKFEVAVVQS